ncbi:hypothetical protein [Streptomyces violascens]|uniref:hypothetical protein n=1 Tax=Streptomyces violascens TaxID=67381 RepID=UPI00167785FB|nr:hypothetical protein [Streptomyces violascens]GGU39043.1 hypothetical protein GCM10010289_69900 [Streptomyces violascens]
MSVLLLTREHAQRVITFDVTGAPDIPPEYLCDPSAGVPPMRPTQLHVTYYSRGGSPWELDALRIRGPYVPAEPASQWADRMADGLHLYPPNSYWPTPPRPPWTTDLARAVAVPARNVTDGAMRATVTSDLARRARFFTVHGGGEISDWPMPVPIRPDVVRITYLNSRDTAWGWDEARFDGPLVATGRTPGPDQVRGRRSYYPTSLLSAPSWVHDVVDAHRVAAPLPAGQRP